VRPRHLILAGLGVAIVGAAAWRTGTSKLTLSESVSDEQLAHGTWRHMFDLHGLAATAPLPLWIAALFGASILGFPYLWVCARTLPDRGWAVSRTVGLMLVTWITWLLASVRVVPFSREAIALAILAVASGAVVITMRSGAEMLLWLRTHARLVLVAELLFWLVFLATLYVRWSNPDLWHPLRGGEKPMDFAYLNAVTKSSSFPPYDPWFAGGQMNYYYYGFVQVAALAKLTAIPPAIAYNLAIPTLAGLLATGAFSATLGLTAAARIAKRAIAVSVFAALLVTVLGNLGEVRVLRLALHQPVANDWWFWNASRVIHPGEGEPGPISEFPAFTFIYADLHAHAMALPLAALALALTVAVVRSRGGTAAVLAPTLALLALVLGALWVTNTWDLPTYALLALCGIALTTIVVDHSRTSLLRCFCAAVGVIGGAYVAFLPFHLHSYSVFDGVQRWEGRQTPLFDYLTIHGLFLFAIVSGFAARFAFSPDLCVPARRARIFLRRPLQMSRTRTLERALARPGPVTLAGVVAVGVAIVVAIVCALTAQWPAVVVVPLLTLAALTWPTRCRRGTLDQSLWRLLIGMVGVAGLLTLAVEYYVLRAIDIGRVNTVFKTYLQVWVLWGIAAAVSVGTVWGHCKRLHRGLWNAWTVALAALVLAAGTYPVMASRAKIKDRFDTSVGKTLDGSAFMSKAVFVDKDVEMRLADDRAAMRWILEHLDGSPVVAEVNTAPTLYGWEGRYSVYTGNPTIVGWDFHQRQQRPPLSGKVDQRVRDVQLFYGTSDAAVAHRILRYYGASYVVVGPLERAYFPNGTAKWAQGVGRYWTRVYDNGGVQIYRVLPAAAGSGTPTS
jgi:YYY domain-containing protein